MKMEKGKFVIDVFLPSDFTPSSDDIKDPNFEISKCNTENNDLDGIICLTIM